MSNKRKNIRIILGVLSIIVSVFSITYAAFRWVSDPNRGYISGSSECFNILYTKGTDILSGNIELGQTYRDGINVTVKASIDEECDIDGIGTLYIDTKTDTSDVMLNLIRYQVLENGTPVEGASGIINAKGKQAIYTGFEVTEVEKSYTVYVWVNTSDVTDNNVTEVLEGTYIGAVSMSVEGR